MSGMMTSILPSGTSISGEKMPLWLPFLGGIGCVGEVLAVAVDLSMMAVLVAMNGRDTVRLALVIFWLLKMVRDYE